MIKDYSVSRGSDDMNSFWNRYHCEGAADSFWKTTLRDQESIPEPFLRHMRASDEYTVMSSFLRKPPSETRVLDAGCGIGHWTVFLSHEGFQVTGLDISQHVIARLTDRFPKVDFRKADVRQTGLPDSALDVYLSWGVIEHFEIGLRPCLTEAYRVLKPGGLILVTVPFANQRHLNFSRKYHPRTARSLHSGNSEGNGKLEFYQWRLTRMELHREMEISGFLVDTVMPVNKEEGICRILSQRLFGFQIKRDSIWGTIALRALKPVFPKNYACHMLLGVGLKP